MVTLPTTQNLIEMDSGEDWLLGLVSWQDSGNCSHQSVPTIRGQRVGFGRVDRPDNSYVYCHNSDIADSAFTAVRSLWLISTCAMEVM